MLCFQIRVNSVLPTAVNTEMFQKYVEEIKGTAVEAELKDLLARTPYGYFAGIIIVAVYQLQL